MDITTLFKACVKTARIKNKSLPVPEKTKFHVPKQTRVVEHEFNQKTRQICQELTQLRDYLVVNRTAYMKFGCHLKGRAQKMTDSERDVIDRNTDQLLETCTELLIALRKETRSYRGVSKQAAEYMDYVQESLINYLKSIFSISNQMRTYRVKKELETYKLLKLKADKHDIPEAVPKRKRQERRWSEEVDAEQDIAVEAPNGDVLETNGTASDDEEAAEGGAKPRRSKHSRLALDEEIAADQSSYLEEEEESELSPEDIQMFEMENKQLFNELKGLSEEVAQIEKNVTEIAKLQDLFTEKVNLN